MSWKPDPEARAKFLKDFPPVNPHNPTKLNDAEYGALAAAGDLKWERHGAVIRQQMEQVIHESLTLAELAKSGRHSRQVEKWFDREVDRLLYEPQLASGRHDEAHASVFLNRVARKLDNESEGRLPGNARSHLQMLAMKCRELAGRYYIFKPWSEPVRLAWEKARKAAQGAEDVEALRIADIVLKGIPQWITDFVVEPLYVLVKVNGTRVRVVRIRNVHGEVTPPLHWPAEEYSSPKPMRIWLANNANCANWAAGERELNYMGMDVGQQLVGKEVVEVALRGHHHASGIWFYADCALKDGKPLTRDKNGVYWLDGKGYLPSERDQEGEHFRQGPTPQVPGPFMHPLVTVTDDEARKICQFALGEFFDCLGGYAGWLAMGAALALYGAKEMLGAYSAVPGLWTNGEPAQGKSSVVRWLTWFFGFTRRAGTPLPGSTQAAWRSALTQYGDMPLWMEEFQPHSEKWTIDMLKACYDRTGAIKKTFGDLPRDIRVGAMVTGVATSSDAQLRSRYCHVLVCAKNRIKFDNDRYKRMEAYAEKEFYKLGRFILAHREEFGRIMVEQVGHWIKDPKLMSCDDRSRIVHGAAYGAIFALVTLLQSHEAKQLREFKEFLRYHIEGAQRDVRDQLYVTMYFEHLLGAERSNQFGYSATDLRRYMKVSDKPLDDDFPTADAAVSPRQRELGRERAWCAWKGKRLYLVCQGTVEVVMAYRRTLGITENLSRKDLHDQLKGRPYLVPPPPCGSHQVRFACAAREIAWCVDLDQHEMGRLEVSDEEFEASLHPTGDPEVWVERAEWKDPRKGPLYALVERLEQPDGQQKKLGE